MRFRKAVLLIHGFAGGVYDLENLQYALNVNWQLDVFSFTLPGHQRNLSMDVKYQEWIDATYKQIDLLIEKGYHSIYVIGHSMGGILAAYAAIKYKQVKKVIFLSPAFEYLSKDDKVGTFLKKSPDIVKTYHLNELFSRVLKVSLPMFREFMKIVRKGQELPQHVTVPVLIFQGLSDDIVPKTSSEFVYDNVKGKKWLIYLSDTTHDIMKGRHVTQIEKEIEKFLTSSFYHGPSIRNW